MQIAPVSSSITISQLVAPSGAIADVLPKTGELAVNALFAPVEEAAESFGLAQISKEPIIYTKPSVKSATPVASSTSDEDEQEENQASGSDALDESDALLLRELQQRDQDVRNHEQAHKAVGGQHAGAANYTFQAGPDGVRYAVGGEVPIDMSAVAEDPEATLDKMQLIQRAALAPAEPSSQDRMVAAEAGQLAAQALNDIAEQKLEQNRVQAEALKIEQQKIKLEEEKVKKAQEDADKKAEQQEQVSAAERFAQYNSKMTRINEVLLKLSMPQPVAVGQLLNAKA